MALAEGRAMQQQFQAGDRVQHTELWKWGTVVGPDECNPGWWIIDADSNSLVRKLWHQDYMARPE
jgi:hypothetical protein